MNASLKKNIGTILILVSLIGFFALYYPYLKEVFYPPVVTQNDRETIEFSIEIPSIDVFSKVIEDVDPFDKDGYLEKLKQGVAHAKGTSLPGDGGTVYLFAHSSDVPWRITRYNTAFFKLDFVGMGELIYIRKNGEVFAYEVMDKKTVWPSEVSYLVEDQGDILILQTCTPVGTDLQRLLVFAKPV